MASAEVVGRDGGEQGINLAPGEVDQHEHDGEPPARDLSHGEHEEQTDRLQRERDDHRRFTANLVGRPAPENPAAPVGQRAERGGQHQRAGRETPRLRDRTGVGRDHQPACRHQDEHRIQGVELRRPHHFGRGEVPLAELRSAAGDGSHRSRRGFSRRMSQKLRDAEDHQALEDAGADERRLIPARLNRGRDDRNEQRRAAAESRGHDAGRQAAAVLEPFQRRPDRPAVDERGADARRAIEHVQHRQRRGVPQPRPAEAAQQSGGADEPARAEAIDEPSIERLDPGLKQDEEREGELNVGELPAGARLQRFDEERPGVLQVRDHDHRDQRRDELEPAIVQPHDPPPRPKFTRRAPQDPGRSAPSSPKRRVV